MLYKCPYPECNHTFNVLTHAHAKEHGMSRDDLLKKHGKPKPLQIDQKKLKQNTKQSFVSTATHF